MNEVACDGGVMREVYKDPGWGQVNVRTLPPGARAGGHRHPHTWEMWALMRGQLWVELEFDEPVRMVRGSVLAVPNGWGHAVTNDGTEEAVLVFMRDRLYDPDDPDKEPWDWRETA